MTGHLAAFMSYARFDDEHDDGQLTAFRQRLAAEVRIQTGEEFLIFQDRDIAWGENWQERIVQALDTATLLLVIITPGLFRSTYCRDEIQQFLDRERQLGRNDLILPVYYIATPQISDPSRRAADPLAAALAARQYADWRELRFELVTSQAARKAIAHLAARMGDTFWRTPATTPAPAPAPAPEGMPESRDHGPAAQAVSDRARTELPSRHLDDAAEMRNEQLRLQLVEAEARADQAAREASEIRRRLASTQSAVPFWDVLDPTEREQLRIVASLRTFAAGATIMEQGDPADYVLVILGGRANICARENGKERVLAERSRGQLIGERAALQVSVRSASVIALDMIYALVIQTRDFAAFISANPRILAFVQDQRHARGTDEPAGSGHDHREPIDPRATSVDGNSTGQPVEAPTVRQQSLNGENCTIILTDVVAFGAHKRTDQDRRVIRETLSSMIKAAMQGYSNVWMEDRGDGILMVVPPETTTARTINQLLRVLPGALDQHNSNHRNPAQFQLRVSVSVGPIMSDTVGVSGEAIIVAARMVDAPAFKEAFTGSPARLGFIVSPFVYDTVVRHEQDKEYVARYSLVPVEVKESRITAWMMLVG